MINSNIEYANAYTEILEIFKYLDENDYKKIPKSIINVLTVNANEKHIFKYDITKKLNEQNISKKSKEILAFFFCEYWATEEQKMKIKIYDNNFYKNQEKIAIQKYPTDNLFKNKIKNENQPIQKPKTELIEIKKHWYTKFITFLRKILYRD